MASDLLCFHDRILRLVERDHGKHPHALRMRMNKTIGGETVNKILDHGPFIQMRTVQRICRALGFEMLFIPTPLVPAEWRRFVVGPCRFDRPHGNSKAAKPR